MLNLFGSKGFSFNIDIINSVFQEILPISVVLLPNSSKNNIKMKANIYNSDILE